MYTKECKWCKKNIEVEKQCLFALHVCNCKDNPNKELRNKRFTEKFKGAEKVKRIILNQKCPKCSNQFEQKITEAKYKKGRYKKYCSIKCANSKEWTEEHKKRLSKRCKESEKVINANKRINENRKNGLIRSTSGYIRKNRIKKVTEFTCLYCGKKEIDKKNKKDRKYHHECWLRISGGIKEGSSRGKSGWYKGYWCDSSYELAFVIYNIDHKIKFERNKEGFTYVLNKKERKFYPDFKQNDEYIEIKNFKSEETNAKIYYFPYKITVFYKEDVFKKFFPYVISKYGKNFIDLYENKNIKGSTGEMASYGTVTAKSSDRNRGRPQLTK